MTTKVYYSWSDFGQDITRLESMLNPDDYDVVVGIARGGLVPAVELSHHLGLPLVCLNWQTRDGQPPDELPIDVAKMIYKKRVLFVDDICDSGETLHQIYDALADQSARFLLTATSVCLHFNSGETLFKPDFYAVEINKTLDPIWLVYPWEKE